MWKCKIQKMWKCRIQKMWNIKKINVAFENPKKLIVIIQIVIQISLLKFCSFWIHYARVYLCEKEEKYIILKCRIYFLYISHLLNNSVNWFYFFTSFGFYNFTFFAFLNFCIIHFSLLSFLLCSFLLKRFLHVFWITLGDDKWNHNKTAQVKPLLEI